MKGSARTRIGDGVRLVIQPAFGLHSLLITDLIGGVLIPLLRLFGVGVRDLVLVNPILGLLVLGIVDLLRRVEGRLEVLEQATSLLALAVDENIVGVVGAIIESKRPYSVPSVMA